jgi:hypothetical protein
MGVQFTYMDWFILWTLAVIAVGLMAVAFTD